jgi:protein TonB
VELAFAPAVEISPQPKAKSQIASGAGAAADADRRAEMARRLELQIEREWKSYQQRPQRRFIGASAPELRFERYIEEWRAKVERTAEVDYRQSPPDRRSYGSLVMTVSIRSDGSLEAVEITHSSGQLNLDAEALRIMRLAAPFAPFPADIAQDTDVLSITRTLTFTRSNQPEIR